MDQQFGFIYPAFINEFSDQEVSNYKELGIDIDSYLNHASELLNQDFSVEAITKNNFPYNELSPQVLAYCLSCSVTDFLKNKLGNPSIIAGYSMGLYAALYCGNAITFQNGLIIIKAAFELMKESAGDNKYGVATIVGLDRADINKILNRFPDAIIINQNNSHSFVLSGFSEDVDQIVDTAKLEGAISTKKLDVTIPYHTRFIGGVDKTFFEYLLQFDIEDSEIDIISLVDQSVLKRSDQILLEISRNLTSTLNWKDTFVEMLNSGFETFFECGSGRELFKVGRFIEGDFTIIPLNKLKKFLHD